MKLKICAIQMSSSFDRDRTIQKSVDFLSMAAKGGVNIVCFPELFHTGWFPQFNFNGGVKEKKANEYFGLAEDLNGKTIKLMQEQAKKHGMVIIAPFFEKSGSSYYNSTAVISEKGEIIGVYRKIHLPDIEYYYEKSYFSPGGEIPVFETTFGTIGIQMCWDNFYPEVSRILALKGAEIIFAPTASSFSTNNKWFLSISANAFLNGVYVLRVNRVGRDGELSFYGKSFCVAPDGSVLDKDAKINECIITYNIHTAEVDRERENWPFLKNRIESAYKGII